MANDTDLWLSGMAVYTEQGILPSASVRIHNQIISDILSQPAPRSTGRRLDFSADYHLIPGRIDMHIHGAKGADVMDATPDALDRIRSALAAEGVTGFLATTVTESIEKIDQALQTIGQYQRLKNTAPGAEILGVHLEGPFISPRHPGAHRAELILPPSIDLFDRWQQASGNHIKSVTIAPEVLGGIEFIRHIRKQGVIASIGHTDADFAVTELAIRAGAQQATHLFNAMRPFHHRQPGCVGAVLTNSRIRAELITDGLHCHPQAIQLALQSKGIEGLILVTDAMRAKCCDRGNHFDLGGQTVIIRDGEARLADGTLAGSLLTMTQAVKNMMNFTNSTLSDLIYLTSINPARALNIYDKTGSIALGKDADLTILDEDFNVVLTLCKGQIIYATTDT